MTSLADDVDLKGNVFGLSICPVRVVFIVLISSELRKGVESVPQSQKPGLNRVTTK